jgi:SAM-dependent methyltransferase
MARMLRREAICWTDKGRRRMQDWGGGYITDIEYLDGFYIEQSPWRMALAATLNGVRAPDFSGQFAYCELGCGRGATITTLAAAHPEAQFHAIDFNPAHIAFARDRALSARLSNVAFHELSFADLAGPVGEALPMFDAITLHGVWSWIAPELQDAVVAFIAKRLQPGGVVYVSYNVLPGRNEEVPLQRLIRELAGLAVARSDAAAGHAVELIGRLAEAKLISESVSAAHRRVQDLAAQGSLTYLAHEYLNEHWRPLYHLDAARAFAKAKLSYVASAELLRNFQNITLSAEQRALLAEAPSSELRETLRDFHDNIWLRKDIYVRGERRLSTAQRAAILEDLELTLVRPPPDGISVIRPDGSKWQAEPSVYLPILAALKERPHRVADLLAHAGIPEAYGLGAVELVGVLAGSKTAAVLRRPSPEAVQASERLNAQIDFEDPERLAKATVVAAPAFGGGLSLSAIELALYNDLRRGRVPDAEDLAGRYAALLREQSATVKLGGKPVEDRATLHAALVRQYTDIIVDLVPLWRMAGIIPTPGPD